MKKIFNIWKQFFISLWNLLVNIVFVLVPLGITAFIYSNSAETLLHKEITPIAQAMNIYGERTDYLKEFHIAESAPNLTGNLIGDYGKPLILSVPIANRRIELVPAILDGNMLIARPNNAHYMFLSDEKGVKVITLYALKSWRTLPSLENIQIGTNLYIDTNREWRYVFQVEDVLKVNLDSYFAPKNANTQLLLVIKDTKNEEVFLARAIYRTVLSI